MKNIDMVEFTKFHPTCTEIISPRLWEIWLDSAGMLHVPSFEFISVVVPGIFITQWHISERSVIICYDIR